MKNFIEICYKIRIVLRSTPILLYITTLHFPGDWVFTKLWHGTKSKKNASKQCYGQAIVVQFVQILLCRTEVQLPTGDISRYFSWQKIFKIRCMKNSYSKNIILWLAYISLHAMAVHICGQHDRRNNSPQEIVRIKNSKWKFFKKLKHLKWQCKICSNFV